VIIDNTEAVAGRAAADKLAEEWEDRRWVPADVSVQWARAAVGRLGEIIAAQPAMLRASMRGADKGASTLSPRPFQGIVECLQNADDLGATALQVAYRDGPRPELLIVHDGSPVTLANVGAMLLPWLSTKDADPDAAGRFGIGQRTLNSLGGPIALHAPPFHFVMKDDGPVVCDPEVGIPGVYDPVRRHTMLVIPLAPSVTCASVAEAVAELDVDALVFLRSIRTLAFRRIGTDTYDLSYAVEVTPSAAGRIDFGDEESDVAICDIEVTSPPACAGRRYRRYTTRRTVKPGETRSNKATGATTPIGVCVPMGTTRPFQLYDRMPLPVLTGLSIGLDAQFDPDSARSTLQPVVWNQSRFTDLARLAGWAALQAFAVDPVTAWNHVPLLAEVATGDDWSTGRARDLVAACHAMLGSDLKIDVGSEPTPLANIAYESADLERLLTAEDVVRLAPGCAALPRAIRDPIDRWRRVLAELDLSRVIGLVDALAILDGDPDRGADWYVAFAALATRDGQFRPFSTARSMMLADGSVTSRPSPSDAWVLVRSASANSLAVRLGLARRLHSAYFTPGAPTEAFVRNLEQQGELYTDRDAAADVFAVLARGGSQFAGGDPIRVGDEDLLILRDAWTALPRERHGELGNKVGGRIELRAVWYGEDGRRKSGWARPVDLYLPAAIDREVDSFAKAADRAPGLRWVDPEYGKLLKQKEGRAAIGAQKLLVAWGVAREPRLIRPKDEVVRWVRDPRAASPIDTRMRTEDQLRSIRTNQRFTHLLDDHWSPDADAVAADIASASIKTRRKRATALVATLSRAWERRYQDLSTATPASAYNGYWQAGPEVRATWLARLANQKWMPDAGSGLRRPVDLQLQAPGSTLRPAERSSTVAKFDTQIQRSGILAALGVKAGPTQSDLLDRLRTLQDKPVTPVIEGEALAIYQLLAGTLRERREGVTESRMTQAQLRNAFRASSTRPGLLLVGGEWRSPEMVLRGFAVFGHKRVFAPHIEGLEPLWIALGVNLPSVKEALTVLREMADGEPSPAELGIAIRALTLVSAGVADMSAQQRAALRRFPLWTGTRWTTSRPVYALEGDGLLAAAPSTMAVWRPGLKSFDTFAPLLEALGIVHLTPADFRAASTPAYGLAEGEELRPVFSRAVALLRQELVRADRSLLDSLSIDWDELLAAPVVVDPELSIVADLEGGRVTLPADAHIGRDPLRLIVRSEPIAATAEGAGAAVASLFSGDRQKAAWAWAAVWPRAVMGEQAAGAVLPKARAERGDGKARLEELARQAAQRKGKSHDKHTDASSPKAGKAPPKPAVQVRKLRELGELEPSPGVFVNAGATPTGDLVFAKARKAKERGFQPGNRNGGGLEASTPRAVLPPTSDREHMALDAVRRALQLDEPRFNDLRAVRGVGVDAIDELRQCYEIKMCSGTELPTDVTLTASEVAAARHDPDFFLAIVTGLEDGAGELRVRFIFDPLANLDVRVRSDLTLTGVDRAEALEFTFARRSGDLAAG
jgi:hypothetical protein